MYTSHQKTNTVFCSAANCLVMKTLSKKKFNLKVTALN